jgi:VanZ family protein
LFTADVPKLGSFLKYWLPALIWMAIIFSASSDTKSAEHSSRILAPFIHWIAPSLSEKSVSDIVFFFRKCAHLTEYAILALLFWRALRKPVPNDARPWRWTDAVWPVFFVALYAASDEIHQLFVPTREGRVTDVIIDTSGAIVGVFFLWLAGRVVKRW